MGAMEIRRAGIVALTADEKAGRTAGGTVEFTIRQQAK